MDRFSVSLVSNEAVYEYSEMAKILIKPDDLCMRSGVVLRLNLEKTRKPKTCRAQLSSGHSNLVLRRKLVRENFSFLVLHRPRNLGSGTEARADYRKREVSA